ncbi:AaceriAFR168Wp [[Ashbya] aceris (nom. inval.)]|nr:AaceriAFR168Wp [[Ashbya] aceris (nom. inval.)]
MPLLLPSAGSCFPLRLPKLDAGQLQDLDERAQKRLLLECRTGAAVALGRSSLFVYGGLTIPLNLAKVTLVQIQQELILHFARCKTTNFRNLCEYISQEVFSLDLLSRRWERVQLAEEEKSGGAGVSAEGPGRPAMRERIFHAMVYCGGCLYVFGGLVASSHSEYELVATNELWQLDMRTKVWTLLSHDPRVQRRFNHELHVLNEFDDHDTHLIIVGGLDNMDKKVHKVDVYNVTRGCWESFEDDYTADIIKDDTLESACDLHVGQIHTNIDDQPAGFVRGSNFGLLVENNEDHVPTLAFYSAPEVNKAVDTNRWENPIVMMPLVPNARGKRTKVHMPSKASIRRLKMLFDLSFVSGILFGPNIIIIGFHAGLLGSNFYAFLYSIPLGKWTHLNINCPHSGMRRHRYWGLFHWESHHKALLLGTYEDDSNLPTVQKFDRMLAIRLQNAFPTVKSLLSDGVGIRVKIARTHSGQGFTSQKDAFKKTDQFESYSRYIVPPSEITSIRSVFPSYASVLGKDALEVYGKSLADFEFITMEGDSVSIPSLLLRKRWGRFFDHILAQDYSKLSSSVDHVQLEKGTDESNSGSSTNITTSLSNQANEGKDQNATEPQGSSENVPKLNFGIRSNVATGSAMLNKKSVSLILNPTWKLSPSLSGLALNIQEQESKEPSSGPLAEETANESAAKGSLTSSSGGMVFRVPFTDSSESLKRRDSSQPAPSIHLELADYSPQSKKSVSTPTDKRRRSSYTAGSHWKQVKASGYRRASHPIGNIRDLLYGTDRMVSSPLNSRRGSAVSNTSSISYVSSSSERMSNRHCKRDSEDYSSGTLTFNINLPPQQPPPTDPLPTLPPNIAGEQYANRRESEHSLGGMPRSLKSSPSSSRCSSSFNEFDTKFRQYTLTERGREHTVGSHAPPIQFNSVMESGDKLFYKETELELGPKQSIAGSQTTESFNKLIGDVRRLSLTPTLESYKSQSSLSAALGELEPLLIPRSLYLPWPTCSVKAFSEFFYTGQVNSKWPFSPVSLDLLHMAKLYEVPLLYDLICEVFYSIIGKKMVSLVQSVSALKELFLQRVVTFLGNDELKISEYTKSHHTFQTLLQLEESIASVDDGYFDLRLMQKVSRAVSISTDVSTDADHDKELSTTSSCVSSPALSPIFGDYLRDSISLTGPRTNPSTSLRPPGRNLSTFRHRSLSSSKKKENIITEFSKVLNKSPPSEGNFISDMPMPESGSHAEHAEEDAHAVSDADIEDFDQDLPKINRDEDAGSTKKDPAAHACETVTRVDSFDIEMAGSSSASSSDSDEDGTADLGRISNTKLAKLRARNSEEAIDPLDKITSTMDNLNLRYQTPPIKTNMDTDQLPQNTLTLDSLASRNAPPPMDYVVELILDATVLNNDVLMMVRCENCLSLSKWLRSTKKKLFQDISILDTQIAEKEKARAGSKHSDSSQDHSDLSDRERPSKSPLKLVYKKSRPSTPDLKDGLGTTPAHYAACSSPKSPCSTHTSRDGNRPEEECKSNWSARSSVKSSASSAVAATGQRMGTKRTTNVAQSTLSTTPSYNAAALYKHKKPKDSAGNSSGSFSFFNRKK